MTTFSIVYTIGTCRTEVHLGSCGRIRSGRGLLRYDVPATSPRGAIARYVVDQHLIVDGMPEPVMCACTMDASAPAPSAGTRELEVEVYPAFGADVGGLIPRSRSAPVPIPRAIRGEKSRHGPGGARSGS